MKRSKFVVRRSIRDVWRDRNGATLVFIAATLPVLMGAAGLTVDVGRALAAKRAFAAETQAAALAGAYALSDPNWSTSSVQTAVTNWNTANPVAGVTGTGSTATLSCNTSVSNLPSCNGTSPNAVSVTRTGTIPTYFLKALGRSQFTLTSSATATKAGGNAKSVNVMFVLDATGSMSNSDPGCTVPGVSHPTRLQCAQYSIQSVLKVMPTSLDTAGLMIFPGMGSQYSPTKHPCATQPSSVPYYTTNIKYQIGTTMDSSFNDGNGNLSNSSPLVQAVGNGTSLTGCVTNKGGQGSFGAEVLAKAQAALPAAKAGTQNVIIYLSDGDYNASKSELNNQTSHVTKQCDQAIAAAQTITSAGTKIYSVAYGAPTSGCSSGDTHNPCTTMQSIASDKSLFYTTNSACQISGSANQVSGLPQLFQAITTTFTKPRLLLN
ncbi:VWA domain-containing protein [Reyranella sp.]|jgi:Flp pilus assembly protein TadG|uniref:VWA domain-containing protein n=1 Tax=Reyranella sp. TaxID=1929291 RepID=UPI002F94AEFA